MLEIINKLLLCVRRSIHGKFNNYIIQLNNLILNVVGTLRKPQIAFLLLKYVSMLFLKTVAKLTLYHFILKFNIFSKCNYNMQLMQFLLQENFMYYMLIKCRSYSRPIRSESIIACHLIKV